MLPEQDFAAKKPERYLSWWEVRPLIGNMDRSTWWRYMKRGEAPAPHKIGPNRVAWAESDIAAWQAKVTGQATA